MGGAIGRELERRAWVYPHFIVPPLFPASFPVLRERIASLERRDREAAIAQAEAEDPERQEAQELAREAMEEGADLETVMRAATAAARSGERRRRNRDRFFPRGCRNRGSAR